MTSTVPYSGLQLNFKTDSSGIPLPPGGGRLGRGLDLITDEHGNVLERLSFDPWGRRRNPTDWTFNNVPSPHLFDRGYTGHEHLDIFGLINMNGRVYDPWLGRFLSPDPFMQSPGYSQSYNRYSYCLNNPLKYIDPSGYTQININSIIDLLLSSHYGGSWSQSGGLHFFSSNEEAIEAAIGSLNNTPGSWSHTEYKNEQTTREIYRFISSTPYNSDLLRGILFGLYYVDYHPSTGKYYYVKTNNEVDLISVLRGEIANLEMEKEASSDGGGEMSFWDGAKLAWDLKIIGRDFPDLISIDINVGSTPIAGGSMTYSVNIFTRGEPGINVTATDQNRFGGEIDWGINSNIGYYQGNPLNINPSSISGPVESISAGWGYSGQGYFGYNTEGDLRWIGFGMGIGLSGGASYGTGITRIIWP
jgi:RHS repeat-associated protein